MPAKTFLVPKDHVLEEILKFGVELNSYSGNAKEFKFNFQGKGLDTPFGMLYIAFAIRSFRKRFPDAICTPVNFAERWYASHMGYFQACGFEIGKLPGEAQGSDTYLPITIIPITKFQDQARKEFKEIGDVIEERSKQLSVVLAQQASGPLVEMLTYTFREMLRNVAEHSTSDTLAYCAQYRTKAKQAEIAILDTGIGIRAALSSNPFLEIKDDRDALNLALMPGISGKLYKGIKKDPYNVWQNSGYGLFAVSRLCGHGGKFTLCSGDIALTLKPDKKEYQPAAFQGTALRIILSAAEVKNAKAALSAIMKEGDKQAQELSHIGTHAATASKMLSSEFRKPKK